MSLRYGELFAGYDGLGVGVRSVLGGETAWFSEVDPAPSRILAHHHPDTPNLGDITQVDFTQVEPVDVITGGFPCQDVSHAGRRAGLIRDGEGRTRSGLWGHMLRAVAEIRPRLVVAENVRGLLSATADSDMEPCPFCMGDGSGSPLRALGAVLGDLADIGYDARWYGLRAADVGAAHGRFRVFLFAWPATDADDAGRGEHGQPFAVRPEHAPAQRESAAADGLTLLPTPACNDMGASYAPEEWDAWTAKMQAAHGNGNGHGKSLSIEAQRLLPTPMVGSTSPAAHGQISGDYRAKMADALDRWGDYTPAIARWEHVIGRPAPDPTEVSPQSRKACAIHGDTQEGRSGKGLSDMREAADPQAVRERATGGPGRIPEADALLPVVREHQGGSREGHAPLESAEAQEECLRDVPSDDQPARASHRPEPGEQRSGEPVDAVRELPSGAPLEGGPGEASRVNETCSCKPRLSPRFCEWLMGLPEGHVTSPDIGLTRNQQLKALGNGVVPQQCAAAAHAFVQDLRGGTE